MASFIELRHLRTIVALRDTGSLVEAAERVFLTQSALSHQLKDLEGRLGCTLFIRKTRPVRFTSAGKRLLRLADDVLPQVTSAERDVARFAGGEVGRLYMAIECHSCFEWLLPALDIYRDQWSDVDLDISGGFHFAPLPALARGDLDLVVTADPLDLAEVVYLPLFRYEAQLAVPLGHALADKRYVEPRDLEDEILITYPVDRDRLDVFTRFLEPAGVEPARVRTAELTPLMVQLVAGGRGLSCLPNWVLHEYLEKRYVVAKSLGVEGVWPTLYAAVRADQRDVKYVMEFVRIARETCFENLVGIRPVTESEQAGTDG